MSLLGLDVGTTGCKAAVFSTKGKMLALAYREYDINRPEEGWAELDVNLVWLRVMEIIKEVSKAAKSDPIKALAISSMGEAVVPVSKDRQILGTSLLNFDTRGSEYLSQLREGISDEKLYHINGNTLGNHYSLTKIMWVKNHQPDVYDKTYKFLHWSGFIAYMLGSDAAVDYSLANRTLLFDINKRTWSDELITMTKLDKDKLPAPCQSAVTIGEMDEVLKRNLGLEGKIFIVSGAHDQCANGVGCGVTEEDQAMYGMGTYLTAMPVFRKRHDPEKMVKYGVNTEHHAVPGVFVSFLYNHGGSMLKWFRDTFAKNEHKLAQESGKNIYPELIAEVPSDPSEILILPHFAPTGPPYFIADSCGVMAGLKLDTTRGDICKGILESMVFYLRDMLEPLSDTGMNVSDFRAVGGGSTSDTWVQLSADILGKPMLRPMITEAGSLGAAIMAGTAIGEFDSLQEGCNAMVKLDKSFSPDMNMHRKYEDRFRKYQRLYPLLADYLREIA